VDRKAENGIFYTAKRQKNARHMPGIILSGNMDVKY